MKKFLYLIVILFPAFSYAQKKSKVPSTYDLIIGTYTTGSSKGIYVYRFYTETGKVAYLNQIEGIKNPSYVCVSKNNKFVYAVNENDGEGEVTSFKFEPNGGKLTLLNKQPSGGNGPCYISVDDDQKNIFVANYGSGVLGVFPLNKDGSIAQASQLIHDKGKGPDTSRQEGPHMHFANLTPDEKYLLANDLGTDKVYIYRYHPSKPEPLTPADPAFVSVKPGNGPRHIAYSPDRKFVYLLQEMGSTLTAYSYNNGKLKEFQSVNMLPKDHKGTNGAGAIHISPNGKFLYATDRLDASAIFAYSINQETGELSFISRYSTYGKNPRDFAIDPTGNYLLVANQSSDSIYEYKIDQNNGRLNKTPLHVEMGNPVCLKFTGAE